MNIERFGMPVIIAASLHGALFLISREESQIICYAEEKLVAIDLPPLPDEPIVAEPDEIEKSEPGPVSRDQLMPPSIPDALQEATSRDVFTVPVTPYRSTPERVSTLEKFTGLPDGIMGGDGPVGRPSIPGVDKLDRVPRAVAQPSPDYPRTLHQDGVGGSVTVQFVVGTDGRVVKAEAVTWTHREFVEPAVRAVWRWRFEPGTQAGRKVSFRMAVPIEFNAAP